MEGSMQLLCVLALVGTVISQGEDSYHRAYYPNPQKQAFECGRNDKTSYLCDPNNLLSETEADQLDRELEKVMSDTKCPCSQDVCSSKKYNTGYKIGVALMRQMAEDEDVPLRDGDDVNDHNLEKARLYAYTLMKNWKLGSCKEEIIIIYSRTENVLYTMIGKTTMERLSNDLIGEISMESQGDFRDHTFQGLLSLITKYRQVLQGKYTSSSSKQVNPKAAALVDSSALSLTSTSFIVMCGLLAALFSL